MNPEKVLHTAIYLGLAALCINIFDHVLPLENASLPIAEREAAVAALSPLGLTVAGLSAVGAGWGITAGARRIFGYK